MGQPSERQVAAGDGGSTDTSVRPAPSASPGPGAGTGWVRLPSERVNWPSAVPFLAVHAVPLLVVVTGVSTKALALLAATFLGRQFLITGVYHRYFAHRTYRLGRISQFVLAFGGTTAAQKGPLWWAAHHRRHHRFADTDRDLHSPSRGFWWSHVGWILCDRYCETDVDGIRDFARCPELRFLDRHDWIGPWSLALLCVAIAGWQGLVVGFFLSTVLLWHTTFTINSVAHVIGRRPYATHDTSGNSALLAVLTAGEGWHNNHHHHPASARLGFRWWQWDPTYYVIRGLSWVGIASKLRVYSPGDRPSETAGDPGWA
jgi:stearoyl-CoA desaturase (delta-9 desaturase)